ncbi:MAG: porin [Rickettsiales bacterium]|nr:MAG: porin [Rickettsiales bacterium]
MINFKKFLLVSVSSCLLISNSLAHDVESDKFAVESDLKVKLKGYAHFQAGLRNQDKLTKDEKKVSNNKENFAFYSQTAFYADVSNEVNGITYGGKIVLVPTAKRKASNDYSGSHIYIESNFGRVELGSPVIPSSAMMVDGAYDSMATFNDWTNYANTKASYIKQTSSVNPSFATSGDFFLDDKLVGDEPIRSIVYYTPKFNLAETTKVQVGISYAPDSSNRGNDSLGNSNKVNMDDITIGTNIDKISINRNVKDIIAGGVSLEQNISDGIDLKLAATGEFGKSAGKVIKTMSAANIAPIESKLSDLRTYNIGALLNVGNLSYGVSYGSLGKSLTTAEFHKTGRNTDYITSAIAYKQGPFGASIGYFKSNQYKNTVDAVSIGTQYQLAPGLKPYAEISGFSLKGRPEFNPELPKKKTRGTVALIGAKLSL